MLVCARLNVSVCIFACLCAGACVSFSWLVQLLMLRISFGAAGSHNVYRMFFALGFVRNRIKVDFLSVGLRVCLVGSVCSGARRYH